MERGFKKILAEREWLPVALLLCLGFALRLAYLGAVPYGLNQDEASAGYEAWALLRGGVDRCGNAWPVLFVSWGSGQNVLMSYLAMPFVAALGLTETAVRLPNAIFGCLTLPVFWLLARRARGRGFGVCALFLLAVCPWHIMMSRWALESNLLPFFLLAGVWCVSLARERPWALAGAAAFFGLSLYAYGTAFFFLPLFLVCAAVWLRRDLRPASFAVSLAIFILLALPIGLCQLRNALGLGSTTFLGLTLPALTQNRQAATSVFGGGGVRAALQNFSAALKLLASQSDGLVFNSLGLKSGGIFYFFGLPAAVLGVVLALRGAGECPAERPVLLALFCALACAFFIDGNINRLNMLWLPLLYFSALGCYEILCKLKSWAVLPVAGILACLVVFLGAYRETFAGEGNSSFYPGLGEAIVCAESANPGGNIYITDYVNQPYIFALFYSRTDAKLFYYSAVYADPDAAFRQVLSFAGFRFGPPEQSGGAIAILNRSETAGREILASFGSYCVCR